MDIASYRRLSIIKAFLAHKMSIRKSTSCKVEEKSVMTVMISQNSSFTYMYMMIKNTYVLYINGSQGGSQDFCIGRRGVVGN